MRKTVVLMIVALVLTTCGGAKPEATPSSTYTPIRTATPVPTPVTTAAPLPTYTQYPTFTPLPTVPPTHTPVPPTSTPKPRAFQEWNTAQAVAAFKAAGLEVESVTPMTKDDYGLAPMTAVEAIRFLIPSLCSDCGGRVFSFASQADLDLVRNYYVQLGKSSAAFFSWTFVNGNVLVQINGDLPEAKARLYETALGKIE